jgi:hypothetical protein
MAWLLIGLLAVAGAFRAVHDTLTHSPDNNRLRDWARTRPFRIKGFCWWLFIDTQASWNNKYKNGDPKQGPAFWGSTTVFVAFTDLWHLSNLLSWAAADAAFLLAAFPAYRWWAVSAVAARRIVFQPLYSWLRK